MPNPPNVRSVTRLLVVVVVAVTALGSAGCRGAVARHVVDVEGPADAVPSPGAAVLARADLTREWASALPTVLSGLPDQLLGSRTAPIPAAVVAVADRWGWVLVQHGGIPVGLLVAAHVPRPDAVAVIAAGLTPKGAGQHVVTIAGRPALVITSPAGVTIATTRTSWFVSFAATSETDGIAAAEALFAANPGL